jgi:tRNA G46 methylase TrmB
MSSKHNYGSHAIFDDTFDATRHLIEEQIRRGGYDVLIEIGCSTGDVIGKVQTNHPRIGLDRKEACIQHCTEHYKDCEFHAVDALKLVDWWNTWNTTNDKDDGSAPKRFRKKPLVFCANNTLSRMPEHLRSVLVEQMLAVAGKEGMCMASYWDGNLFSHAVVNYFHMNKALCGDFNIHSSDYIDWERRSLNTPMTNYATVWHTPQEVQLLFRAMDVDVPNLEKAPKWGKPHIYRSGLAIFIWFDSTSTSNAKGYYDNEEKNYSKIWGEETLHVGRYDLIPSKEGRILSNIERVARAQELHELEFVKLIREKTQQAASLRVVDMGCGYGGLLRQLWKQGIVWSAVGVDISRRMCEQARRLNCALWSSRIWT